MEHPSNDHDDDPDHHKNSETSFAISFDTETTTWLEFPNGGKALQNKY